MSKVGNSVHLFRRMEQHHSYRRDLQTHRKSCSSTFLLQIPIIQQFHLQFRERGNILIILSCINLYTFHKCLQKMIFHIYLYFKSSYALNSKLIQCYFSTYVQTLEFNHESPFGSISFSLMSQGFGSWIIFHFFFFLS